MQHFLFFLGTLEDIVELFYPFLEGVARNPGYLLQTKTTYRLRNLIRESHTFL